MAWRGSFTINIKSSRLIRGFRVHLGGNGAEAVPPAVTINGQRQFDFLEVNRSKWINVPFTPDETLEFNGKVSLQFAASNHQDRRVIIEALKLFGMSRENVLQEKKVNDQQKNQNSFSMPGPRNTTDIGLVHTDTEHLNFLIITIYRIRYSNRNSSILIKLLAILRQKKEP